MARRITAEAFLITLIAILTLWGVVVQLMVRSVVKQERDLTDGDEDRMADEIRLIEEELVEHFTPEQLDVWAADSDGEAERKDSTAEADPNVADANGEFSVPQLATKLMVDGGPDVLLASRLLFPVVDGDWCELKMTRSLAPGSYQLSMSGVLGRWGAQAAAGLLVLQVRLRGEWSPLLGAPRARAEDLEAPLAHNFSVAHKFDGVRFLATTWRTFNSGGRAPPARPPARPPPLRRAHALARSLHRRVFGCPAWQARRHPSPPLTPIARPQQRQLSCAAAAAAAASATAAPAAHTVPRPQQRLGFHTVCSL